MSESEPRNGLPPVQLVELQKAASLGVADIDAGRFLSFPTRQDLAQHFRALVKQCFVSHRMKQRSDL